LIKCRLTQFSQGLYPTTKLYEDTNQKTVILMHIAVDARYLFDYKVKPAYNGIARGPKHFPLAGCFRLIQVRKVWNLGTLKVLR
jgi:hypothetical protein